MLLSPWPVRFYLGDTSFSTRAAGMALLPWGGVGPVPSANSFERRLGPLIHSLVHVNRLVLFFSVTHSVYS